MHEGEKNKRRRKKERMKERKKERKNTHAEEINQIGQRNGCSGTWI